MRENLYKFAALIPLIAFAGCVEPGQVSDVDPGNTTTGVTSGSSQKSDPPPVVPTAPPTLPATPPPAADQVKMAANWASIDSTNVDLGWRLPNGNWFQDIAEAGWGEAGAEAAVFPTASVPAGPHQFWYSFYGTGKSANSTYELSFLNLQHRFAGVVTGPFQRKIVAEVIDGVAYSLFNGWLAPADPNSGGPSGLYPAEAQTAWRNAAEDVYCELGLTLPDGTHLDRYTDAWAQQGFERVVYPRGVEIKSGTHQINFQFHGAGRSADVTHFVNFPGYVARYDERILGNECRIIGVDHVAGVSHLLFNGWRGAAAADAGGLTGAYPAEVLAAWRNADGDVNVDISLVDPSGTYHKVWQNGWLHQGFEFTHLAPGLPIKDGLWRINFRQYGSGRAANIKFDARFANWSFTHTEVLLGDAERNITLSVSGGVATELTNAWR